MERARKMRGHLFIALGSLVAMIIGAFFILALFSPVMQLTEVRIEKSDSRLEIEHVQLALAPLFGKHLMLISPHEVRILLEEELPDIRSVAVGKDYPSLLIVRVSLDPLVARLSIATEEEVEAGAEETWRTLSSY